METELRAFLAEGTRPDVQLSALQLLLSLSNNSDFWSANSADPLIDDLLLLTRLPSSSQSSTLLLAIFVNIASHSQQIAAKLTASDPLLRRCFSHSLLSTNSSTKCVSGVHLLANLSRFCPHKLYEQILKQDSHFLHRIFVTFLDSLNLPLTAEEKEVDELTAETFFGFLLVNLSTVPSAGQQIVQNNLAQLVGLLGQNVPDERRSAALNTLFNLSMFDDLHELLLRDEDNLLGALLWPLVDSDDRLEEDEIARLPVQLQYWEGRRADNCTAETIDIVLRTLYQFCATRHGRQSLRRKGIYALLRELDKATTPRRTGDKRAMTVVGEGRMCTLIGYGEEEAANGAGLVGHVQVLRALIGVLIRSEEDIGVADDVDPSIRHLGMTADNEWKMMGKATAEEAADRTEER